VGWSFYRLERLDPNPVDVIGREVVACNRIRSNTPIQGFWSAFRGEMRLAGMRGRCFFSSTLATHQLSYTIETFSQTPLIQLALETCLMTTLNELQATLAAFAAERDWDRGFTPENLAKSISIEAAELLECYQWGKEPDPKDVRYELADVLTYCLQMARRLGVDPAQIVLEKLEVTRKKYPVKEAETNKPEDDAQSPAI